MDEVLLFDFHTGHGVHLLMKWCASGQIRYLMRTGPIRQDRTFQVVDLEPETFDRLLAADRTYSLYSISNALYSEGEIQAALDRIGYALDAADESSTAGKLISVLGALVDRAGRGPGDLIRIDRAED